jgi:hypothetical protein
LTSEQQASDVEGILRGDKQCAYCRTWQPLDQMKEYVSWSGAAKLLSGPSYLCKQNDMCISRLWDNVRADRERAGGIR